MHIVLLILKLLLIILLSLIGLVILLALLVLFAPIRYKLYARKKDDIWAKMTARWLGFVLCFKLTYDQDNGMVYRLRLFGGTLFGSDKPPSFRRKKNSDELENDDATCGQTDPSVDDQTRTTQNTSQNTIQNNDVGDDPGQVLTESFPSADPEDSEFLLEDKEFEQRTEGDGENLRENIWGRIGRKIDSIFKKIAEKYRSAAEKIASLKKKKDGYTKLMNNVRTKEALRVVKTELMALLRHLKPSKLKGQLTYGTGDPASTGQHLGIMSAFFPLYYDNIDITPDFENKILEGDIMIKGSIRLWSVGWCALKVMWNKNVKITISRFKKISGGN